MKPIGHRSTVYGNEGTPLIAVYELDTDEQLTATLLPRYLLEKRELEAKGYRERLKPSEVGRQAELGELITVLRESCRHRVFNDTPGFIYSLRSCVACGAHMGSV